MVRKYKFSVVTKTNWTPKKGNCYLNLKKEVKNTWIEISGRK